MDLVDKSLVELEWPQLLARYAAHCQSEPAREVAAQLVPATTPGEAESLLQETDESLRLLKQDPWSWFGALSALDSPLERARLGSVLSGVELRQLARMIETAQLCATTFRGREALGPLPALTIHFSRITDLTSLNKPIDRALDESGHVKDNASPALSSLRAEERRLHSETREKLEAMVQGAFRDGFLRDRIWDFRDGRYLVPVRSDSRSKVPGTVVENSTSKATVFVEPAAIRTHNDRIRQVQVDIEEEVYRILRSLSETLHPQHAALRSNYECLVGLDLIFARGRFALELGGLRGSSRPTFQEHVQLEGLWHPLLAWVLEPSHIIRNHLAFGAQGRVLIVSGPNTGGKTVLLKSLGLAALMARAGFHLACAGEAKLPFFTKVLSQIGDAQNLELSLSSFSGSVVALNEILGESDGSTLVLVDEILHATDPDEASALSRSILLELVGRGSFAMITTHLNGLKVAEKEVFQNASMEFDPVGLRPTFRLRLGVPGRSHAMEIAERLGMPSSVVGRARTLVDASHFRYEEALQAVEEKERELDRSRGDLESAQSALSLREAEFRRREQDLDATKRTWKKKIEDDLAVRERAAIQKIDGLLEDLKKEFSDVAARHAFSQASRRIVHQAKEELKSVQAAADAAIPTPAPTESAPTAESPLRKGGKVWLKHMKSVGVLQSSPDATDKPAEVLVGSMKMRVEWKNLRPMEESGQEVVRRPIRVAQEEASVPEELHLIGKTTAEAEAEISIYLDRASRSGRAFVRIVHGHGSGALKRTVREYLKRCGYDLNFRPGSLQEGGDGCTIVEFL